MGIALSAIHDFFSPLQSLTGWLFASAATQQAPVTERVVPAFSLAQATPVRPGSASCVRAQAHRPVAHSPLRVVRVMDRDAGRLVKTGGRMVISGRLADVCAELDRLAALEARAGSAH